MELFSFEAKELTQKDFDAARAIDLIYSGNPINMKDFSYDLKQESIALFPAEPRGSSKLLRVNSNGQVSNFDHFGNNIVSLLDGCHIVFNDSRVLDARLTVDLGNGNKVELMVSTVLVVCLMGTSL
jgi:S-adenosylmethionine:tRNA-ribosyltransferase-isomerase (queuine synthetase)